MTQLALTDRQIRSSRRRNAVLNIAALVGVAQVLADGELGKLLAIVICIYLAVRWPLRRLVMAVLIVSLAAEDPASQPYNELWKGPIQHIGDFWFDTIKKSLPFFPLPLAPVVVVVLIMMARLLLQPDGRRALLRTPRSFRQAMVVAFGVIAVMAAYGVATGGDVQQIYYQTHGLLIVLPLAVVAAATCADLRTGEIMCKIIVVISAYRAVMAVWVYFSVVKDIAGDPPLYVTTHHDSLLWAVGITYLLSKFVERPNRTTGLSLLGGGLLFAFAIVVNNRRLAWLVVGAAVLYVLASASSAAKRRLSRALKIVVPVALLYIAAGLAAPPSRVFAPVQSLQSVVSGDDASSQTRKIEDYNLTFTMKASVPLPLGFGKEYTEVVQADDISEFFAQYRYLPHNSVLGLMMNVGPIGLMLILLPLLLGVRESHDARRRAANHRARTQCAVIMGAWIGYVLQSWGDLGIVSVAPSAMMGALAGLGIAMRPAAEPDARQERRALDGLVRR